MRLPRKSILVGVSALTAFAFAAPAAAAEPSGTVLHAGGDTAVADSYIVVFKDSSVARASVDGNAATLASRHGGSVVRTYRTALRGFELRASAAQAARVAANPNVAYVEQNHLVHAFGTQTNPPSWGLDRIDQRNLPLNQSYTYPNTAPNVHAYIIDTGIRTTHQDFGGRATSGFDAVDGGAADDCNGHGTHVAGTVGGAAYGVAKGVQLVAVRVLNCQGSGTNAQVVGGIDWVTANAQQARGGQHEPRRRRQHRHRQRREQRDQLGRHLRDRGRQRQRPRPAAERLQLLAGPGAQRDHRRRHPEQRRRGLVLELRHLRRHPRARA